MLTVFHEDASPLNKPRVFGMGTLGDGEFWDEDVIRTGEQE